MPITTEQFREIFGSFPTSLSIVTAIDADNRPRGFTCNAVCAVSTEPPLLLVGVDEKSQTLSAILSSQAFVVNFLAATGAEVANIFAGKNPDKFANVGWRPSTVAGGAPVLAEVVLSYAECRVVRIVEAGDHRLIIGRVDGGAVLPREALLYCQGDYGVWPASVASVVRGDPDVAVAPRPRSPRQSQSRPSA